MMEESKFSSFFFQQRQATKKQKTIPPFQVTNFFNNQQPYNKFDLAQQTFLEDLVLYIAKGYRPFFLLKAHG